MGQTEKKRKNVIRERKASNKKLKQSYKNNEDINITLEPRFQRRIINPDLSSCWLNSCLQLLLAAIDGKLPAESFNSNLGVSLETLHSTDVSLPLDPSGIRHLITEADDLRINSEKNELAKIIMDPRELRKRLRDKDTLKLNL